MFYMYGGLYNAPPFQNNYPNASMDYWARSLFQRLQALIDFEGLPEGDQAAAPEEKVVQYAWDKDALKFGLFMLGYQIVFRSKTYGVVAQPGTLTGFGLQYQPAGAIVNTPFFQFDRPLKLGVEASLIKLSPDYVGVYDIITKYAAELKEIDTSIRSSARNSRLAYAMIASSDKSARTLKAIREKIINGDDAIVDDRILQKDKANPDSLPWYQFDRDLKANYILGDLLDARRTTLVDFYREIGVRMLDDKKERMLTAEVDAGNAETFIRSEVWIETLKESCRKVNEMFGTSIKPILNRPDIPGGSEQEVNIDVSE
jgi:hypothetical protein